MKKLLLTFLLLLTIQYSAFAQKDSTKSEFSVRPIGKLFMDGALFASPQKDMFKDGVAIPDVRVGVVMKYGKWTTKVDVGFAYNAVGLKDCFVQYDFNNNDFIRGGSFIHQYGLNGATPPTDEPTMEDPTINAVFDPGRQLGIMYQHSDNRFFATLSIHAEPKATTAILRPNQFTQQGYGILTRLAWHPFIQNGRILQFGISGGFGTPQNNSDKNNNNIDTHDSFTLAANFPTRVTQVRALDATVDHAKNMFKFTPDVLLGYDRVAMELQYFYAQINRRDGFHAYRAQGGLVVLRSLILGGKYDYDKINGTIAIPKPKSLEFTLGYNYADLSDANSGIYGGKLNNASATLSYYINKYMCTRLHYSYTHAWNRHDMVPTSLNAIMARIQVMF